MKHTLSLMLVVGLVGCGVGTDDATDGSQDQSDGLMVSTPLAYLKLDEAVGAMAFADSSGLGNRGSCAPPTCPTLGASAVFGTGARFDGIADKLRIPGTALLEPASTVSLGAYVNVKSTSVNGGEVVSIGDNFVLRVQPDGNLKTFFYVGNGWLSLISTGVNVKDGKSHHVVGQKSLTDLEIFVDGVLVASAPATGKISYSLGHDVVIGNHGNDSFGYAFGGTIDEVRIYNRPLLAAEIQAQLAGKLAPPPPVTPPSPSSPPAPAPGPVSKYHLYVATNGSDSNPGTQSAPLKTIARADALASADHTIHVAPGTYNVAAPSSGSAGILTNKSGTAAAHIRFVSDVKWGAKIVFSGTGLAWDSKGSYVDIEGFDISGSGRTAILAEGGYLSINDNFIHDLTVSGGCNGSGGAAIDTWGPGGNVVISGNIVRNIGYSLVAGGTCNTVQGIYIANQNNVVTNNIVSGVAAVGIQQWHGATDSTIVNNTVFHSKMGILIGQGDAGATATGSQNNYVANNLVYDNKVYGIVESGKVGGNNRYVDNLVYSSGTSWSVKGTVSGSISADPLFVNYKADGSGDYHVSSGSPAIDRGTSVNAPKTDFAGLARPRGAAFDVGAYEF